MSLTERLFEIANLGAEWVLWLLLVLSVVSIAVMAERAFFLIRHRENLALLQQKLSELLGNNEFDTCEAVLRPMRSMEAQVIVSGIAKHRMGVTSVGELMTGALAGQKQRYERFLPFLATLGSNAPFIGLFGTVLGIIQAFARFDINGGPEASAGIMASISEALIATGAGLLVAIPAVISFNYFKTRIAHAVSNTEQLVRALLAYLASEAPDGTRQQTRA